MKYFACMGTAGLLLLGALAGSAEGQDALGNGVYFNRAPLNPKPYAELPLGAIKPGGWLLRQLQVMAEGLTGHLDTLYPEVCGERNAWLGGDGDTWERGPYWIDGLYPLAALLDDTELNAKAMKWIDWTLANQRPNGQIGPYETKPEARTQPPPPGAQTGQAEDWWPRMVMLKILQQHYMATGDKRAIDCMTRYFRYQLSELKTRPLYDPENPDSGSWWAARRGGDNVMSAYWLYNVTGETFLLELAELLKQQTYPWIEDFESGEKIKLSRFIERHGVGDAYHCVNLAHALKYPAVYYQGNGDPQLPKAMDKALKDIRIFHGQPHGLWGGDEGMHGTDPTRGSEFCTISEAMFSLEKNFEITGEVQFADLLERVAFNPLPTQANESYTARQYFQQANQISCTISPHKFMNHPYDANVFGLLNGYPCCTCNMHQAWPKFTAHLWMAGKDGGLAAMAYAPCHVTAKVGSGIAVTITEETGYPFRDEIRFTVSAPGAVKFPLHLRIPAWCHQAAVRVNGEEMTVPLKAGSMAVIDRTWNHGDTVVLRLPMQVRFERGHENSVTVLRGPLVYALRMEEQWQGTNGIYEVRSPSPWNFSLFEKDIAAGTDVVAQKFAAIEKTGAVPSEPWNLENAPVTIKAYGVRNPLWSNYNDEAGPLPWSSGPFPKGGKPEPIILVPYGCSTLRISAFPTVL